MKEIKPYTPTKACPHRYCRVTHRMGMGLGGFILVVACVRYPLMVLGMVVFVTLAVGVSALVHKRSMMDELTTGAITDDLKPVVPLVVRPVWASIALAMDVFYLFNGCAIVGSFLTHPATYHGVKGLAWYLDPIGMAMSVAGVWFITYAHRKATEPAAPKRVPVPEAA